jgi:VWFA-related protein
MSSFSLIPRIVAAALACCMAVPGSLMAQQDQQGKDTDYTFRVSSSLVLVNIVARDNKGNLVTDLKREDFTLLEDGKPQSISSFDFENIEQAAQTSMSGGTNLMKKGVEVNAQTLKNHRLVVLFFDLVSLQPEDAERAVQASVNFVDKQMTAADFVGIISLNTSLTLNQDFTADKELLKRKLNGFISGEGDGFQQGSDGSTDGTPDTGAAYVPDDTEFNTFNNDRRLQALQAVVTGLSKIDQKKSLIYFSSGLTSNGLENYAALRKTADAARRANTAIYTLDSRGLQALPPGGDASTASLRGTSSYSGAAFQNQQNSNFSSQETLSTLAEDTGGKAFLDTNDFSGVFKQVQRDSSAYYILGFRSNNPAKDGRYRRLSVKVNRPGIKLEYRSGYFAPKDFQHFNKEDREQQLVDELNSDLPDTDVALYVGASYFRAADDNHFYVPVSVVVPGSQIPFTQGGDKEKATIDVIGSVRNEAKMQIGTTRETVKLNLDATQEVRRKNVQYNTAFLLPPGNYKLKFVVRENQTGHIGSFETDITVPDLKKGKLPVRLSSIVLGNQLLPAQGKRSAQNPLVYDGKQILPNIAHVFSSDQNLYLHYEVYDPAKPKEEVKTADGKKANAHLLTSIQFFQGKTKVFETPLVEASVLNAPERKAHIFEFSVPLGSLQPGYYTCQISVIDDAAGAFVFPRTPLLIKPTPSAPTQKTAGIIN